MQKSRRKNQIDCTFIGSRVVLSSLDSLNKNQIWNDGNFTIASVHLMASTVDNEEVSMYPSDILNDLTNWASPKADYGKAIKEEVTNIDNLFSPKDNVLVQIYPLFESDQALGQSGYQKVPYDINLTTKSLPDNYYEKDVRNEIVPICDADADGKRDLPFTPGQTVTIGDNHGGYMGYRDIDNKSRITHDGAIDVVVDRWNNTSTISENQDSNMTGMCQSEK